MPGFSMLLSPVLTFFSTSASSCLDHLQSWALLWRIPRPTCHSGYYRLNTQCKFKMFNHHDYFGFLENFSTRKNKFSFAEEKINHSFNTYIPQCLSF